MFVATRHVHAAAVVNLHASVHVARISYKDILFPPLTSTSVGTASISWTFLYLRGSWAQFSFSVED